MALKVKLDTQSDEFALGLCFSDNILLAYTFWASSVRIEGEKDPKLAHEQKLMFCDESPKLFMCTGRKTAKSVLLSCKIQRIPMLYEGTGVTIEGMVTAPRQKDLNLLYTRVIERIKDDPLLMSTVKKEIRGDAPEFWYRNNYVWYWRIEGSQGTDDNMRGLRCRHIVGDEQEGSNWVCFNSRKMSALPGCTFTYAGVPPVNGERGTPFYAIDQTKLGRGWSKHKYTTFINPIFHDEAKRKELAHDFGGARSQAYITQVLGEWGDEAVSSFPPGTIAVKHDLPIFVKEFSRDSITPYAITDNLEAVFRDIPTWRCYNFAVGVDYGATSDPCVLIGAYQMSPNAPWCQYCRLTFQGVEFPHLIRIFKHVINHVFTGKLCGFVSDLQALVDQMRDEYIDTDQAMRIWWANPAGTSVDYDENKQPKKDAKGEVLKIRNKQFSHEKLRQMMTNALLNLEGHKLWLGDDEVLFEELRGTTEKKTQGGYTVYQTQETYKGGFVDHNEEALCYTVLAILNGSMLDTDSYTEDDMLAAMGFAGKTEWTPPWESGFIPSSAHSH